jgi:hypothetical protein
MLRSALGARAICAPAPVPLTGVRGVVKDARLALADCVVALRVDALHRVLVGSAGRGPCARVRLVPRALVGGEARVVGAAAQGVWQLTLCAADVPSDALLSTLPKVALRCVLESEYERVVDRELARIGATRGTARRQSASSRAVDVSSKSRGAQVLKAKVAAEKVGAQSLFSFCSLFLILFSRSFFHHFSIGGGEEGRLARRVARPARLEQPRVVAAPLRRRV